MKKIIGALFTSLSFLTFVSCKEKNDNDNTTTTLETTTLDPTEFDTTFMASSYGGGFGYNYSVSVDGVYDNNDIDEELIIPNEILHEGKTRNVIAINSEAFKGFTQIKKLTLPASIEFIGPNAFENCTNLESIKFVDEDGNTTSQIQLKSIETDAFKKTKVEPIKYDSDGLVIGNKLVALHADYGVSGDYIYEVSDDIEIIGEAVFKDSELTKIDLNNVKIVADDAFANSDLEEIIGGDNIEYITPNAFNNTPFGESLDSKLVLGKVLVYDKIDTDNYIVDENVESVAAVDGSATSIVIPSNIKNIFNDAFKYVDNLEEVYFEHLYGNVNISNGAFDSDIDLIVPYGALNYYVSNNRSYESQFKTKEINVSFYKDDTFIKTEKFNYGESLRIPNDYISVKDSNGNVYSRGSVIYFHNDINLYLYEGSVILK